VKTCALNVNLFSGAGTALLPATEALLTVRDGNRQTVSLPNKLTDSLTDPQQVYVLRWIAGRHAGVPNFEPPYTLE
jgi:hypothetical protein